MKMNLKICHLTSVHSRYDVRIFLKQCKSLATNKNFEVHLVVADGLGNECVDNVIIHDVGQKKNRIKRMLFTSKMVYKKAKSLQSDLYHFHDPELLPYAKKLQSKQSKVVFDSHEDVSKQLLSKPYLNKNIAKVFAFLYLKYERFICKKLDGIIAATPVIRDVLSVTNKNCIDINNFPILGEFATNTEDLNWNIKKKQVCYVGGISKIRGIKQLVESMSFCSDIYLQLIGKFSEPSLYDIIIKKNGWEKIKEKGFLDRNSVKNILQESIAGIVTYLPEPNHINAQPNKMFEYMSAGIPVIASDFPLWREIIDSNECGVCVNPEKPREIAKAIEYISNNPKMAKKMGENGIKAVHEKYNWSIEYQKLLGFYQKLFDF